MSRPAAIAVMLLLCASLLNGCQTPKKLELTQTGTPAFERFSAVYEIPSASEALRRQFASDSSVPAINAGSTTDGSAPTESASVRQISALQYSPLTGVQSARLTIECPSSTGDASEARLTLELQSDNAATGQRRTEATQSLIIPRQQIELLIFDLARAGFFDEPEPPGARSPLSVTIDGVRVTRNWRLDDRLLDLAHRTLERGNVPTR
ncbi:hypothetical protein GC176_04005 [bacterium]|nr:hypothetical protein [bacterium]